MDVGNPSNFARINSLYQADLTRMRQDIYGCSFSDDQTISAIEELYEKYAYICDPHTAVGYLGWKSFVKKENKTGIVLATAHPAKFADVLNTQVNIPERLQHCLQKPQHSIEMRNDYQKLKEFLRTV